MKTQLTALINRLVAPLGAQLVSALEFRTIHHQRLALLQQAAALHRATLTGQGTTGIVFSFNRPVQLQATLESYFHYARNPVPLIVQFRSTLPAATQAYAEVQANFKHQPVTWVAETTCRDTLITILGNLTTPKLFFLVDDDLFIRAFNLAEFCAPSPLEYVPTPRLHPGLTHSYTMRRPQLPPSSLAPSQAYPQFLTWQWGSAGIEWAYPFSVEGHLLDTAEVLMMTRSSLFKAPNTYEGILHGFAALAANRPGLCYPQPVLFNNPCNKVQTENNNHAGVSVNLSPEYFLEQWQQGRKIDITAFHHLSTVSPHQEVPVSFVPR